MKKKAIKLATSTAIAASAFVAAAPANQADAAVNVEKLVKDAENAAGALKWAISVEGTADGKTAPHGLYNLTKDANNAAKAAVAKTSGSEKVLYTARLQAVELQISRTMAYIDGITAGDKIAADTVALNAAIASKDLDKVEAAYHKITREYKKQAALLDRVYGQSTRDVIRNATKKPAEAAFNSVLYDVTVKMALDKVEEASKAKDWEKAGAYLAEAEKFLPEVSATFKKELTSLKEDVLKALPLQIATVSTVNDTTVIVTLNKAVDAVYSSDFTIDNNLVVTSAVLGADKKTVTLTTTKQATDKTYTLSFKGTTTTFKTAVAPPANITVDGSEVYSDINKKEVVVATFKDKNGKINQAPVTLTIPSALKVTSVNGVAGPGAGGVYATGASVLPNSSGQLVIVVEAGTATQGNNVLDAQLTYTQGTKVEKSAKLNFFEDQATTTLTDVHKITAVGSDYFIVEDNSATPIQTKIRVKSSDVVQIAAAPANLDTFKSKLSKGDIVTGTYNKSSSSVLNLYYDKVSGYDFDVNEDARIRVDGTHTSFTGTGEAGKIVAVYGLTGTLITQTTVSSNGTWSLEVPVTSGATQVFSLYHHTDLAKPVPANVSGATGVSAHTVVPGKFLAQNSGYIKSGGAADGSLNGDTLFLDVVNVAGDEFKLHDTRSITLRDGDGTTVTFTHDVENTEITTLDADTLSVKFGYTVASGGSKAGLDGALTIIAVDGITNKEGLKLKLDSLFNVSGY